MFLSYIYLRCAIILQTDKNVSYGVSIGFTLTKIAAIYRESTAL